MATTTSAAPAGAARVARELKRPYVPVFAILGLVTLFEVQVPTLFPLFHIGEGLQVVFLMGTAVIKAGLVGAYYMHLRYEPNILRILPIFPLAFVVLLLVVLSTA